MIIFLIGYMGSGKSTIGQKLSTIINYQFVDLDTYIEDKEGISIPELFKSKGEIYFRKIENQHLKEVLKLDASVVSLGGGTPCYANNMELINSAKNSKSIYLKALIPQLVARLMKEKNDRPLIAHIKNQEGLTEFIGKHLFERSVFYSQANISIFVDSKSINEIVEEIVMELF